MNEVENLFKRLGKSHIKADDTDILGRGLIDSLDVMELIEMIAELSGKSVPSRLIRAENFSDFSAILNLIESVKNA
ncbi:hypothetical protein [Campylobacter mucosalis]|uniref:hypothetical protein n=1 Tax=Campylobacter mucosalis TaxID=202 RepID=UPI00147060D4|nr:hypothetical protein [Campylobacter mucosalis]